MMGCHWSNVASNLLPGAPGPAKRTAIPIRDADRYEILGEHGRGGIGCVLRAHDRDLGREVAIKQLLSRGNLGEIRFLRLGRSALGTVLMVAYTLRRTGNGETIRIISARRASRKERAAYASTEDRFL